MRRGIATARRTRLNAVMMRLIGRLFLPALLLLGACTAPRSGQEDTWLHRASDFVDPVVPDSLRFGPKQPALKAFARVEPAEFPVAERREVRVLFTIQNTTKKAERLEFSTEQRLEVAVHASDGKRIFLWSEDRLFQPRPAIVVINPSERIEYEAAVPTRDMIAGRDYTVETVLLGHPDVTASAVIKPR